MTEIERVIQVHYMKVFSLMFAYECPNVFHRFKITMKDIVLMYTRKRPKTMQTRNNDSVTKYGKAGKRLIQIELKNVIEL